MTSARKRWRKQSVRPDPEEESSSLGTRLEKMILRRDVERYGPFEEINDYYREFSRCQSCFGGVDQSVRSRCQGDREPRQEVLSYHVLQHGLNGILTIQPR